MVKDSICEKVFTVWTLLRIAAGVGPSTVTVFKRTMKCTCVGKASWRKCLPSSFGGLFNAGSIASASWKIISMPVSSFGMDRIAWRFGGGGGTYAIECRRAGAAAGAGGGFGLGLGGGGLTTSAVGRGSSGSGGGSTSGGGLGVSGPFCAP